MISQLKKGRGVVLPDIVSVATLACIQGTCHKLCYASVTLGLAECIL